jgi:hypothetical protein
MPIALIIGPAAALVGVIAIFFVLRRKSVDKRSMYSARRSQIEHKVRAARQRTLAPHGRTEKVVEPPTAAAPTSTSTWASPQATYEASAFEPPPAAPPPPTKGRQEAPSQSPWDVGVPAPAPPPQFAAPEAPPAPEPTYTPTYPQAPSEQVWTPAPAPSEPARPIEPEKPAAASPAAWSVVSEAKESAQTTVDEPKKKKKGKRDAADAPPGGWALASGNSPGMEADEAIKPPSQLIALAQYAILVVGLVMVLIGVLVMVANSHGT